MTDKKIKKEREIAKSENSEKIDKLNISSVVELDGNFPEFAQLANGQEIEVLPEDASRNFLASEVTRLDGQEESAIIELKKELGSEDLSIIETKAKKAINETDRDSNVLELFDQFRNQHQGELLVIKENKATPWPAEVPREGLKYLITPTAGENFKKQFSEFWQIEDIGDPDNSGFVVKNKDNNIRYVFLYGQGTIKNKKSSKK
ncbi:MAG: hypothetical protein WCP18_03150 [bacterium]